MKRISLIIAAALVSISLPSTSSMSPPAELQAGAASVSITPFGPNPEWDGTITDSGVWGEKFTDSNHNGRWDTGEAFEDDPGNSALDRNSASKYDGIYLAGFGQNRLATGKHDDLWARALVLGSGPVRMAFVSIDVIGYYSRGSYYGLEKIRKEVDSSLGIGEILISSTHSHEGPDTIGAWGVNPFSDGKYPKYLKFVDRQIAGAITRAARSMVPVRMRAGVTTPSASPAIAGLQVRNGERPPIFFDDELRVLQWVGTGGPNEGKTVATLVNWNTHPESMESENTVLTSDFPNAARQSIEEKCGGVALYFSGDLGAVEVVGDNESNSLQRTRFNGTEFPLSGRTKAAAFTFARTEAIGRDVALAAMDALNSAEWVTVPAIEMRKGEIRVPMDNAGYALLAGKGVLDRGIIREADGAAFVESQVYAVTLGSVQIVTAPGELFPELFHGLDKHHRTDCPKADTGRPLEPGVRDRMTGRYRLIFGLCPDELGYIVPGYDFRPPSLDPDHPSMRLAPDACKSSGVPDHYHEFNSASSTLAPVWCRVAGSLFDRRQLDTGR